MNTGPSGDNQRKKTKFDGLWVNVTHKFALSTTQLPNKKWARILDNVSIFLSDKSSGSISQDVEICIDEEDTDVCTLVPLSDEDDATGSGTIASGRAGCK